MIIITCTEAEKDALMQHMGLSEHDAHYPLYDPWGLINWMAHIHWILATEDQTKKVYQVLNEHYPWGEE